MLIIIHHLLRAFAHAWLGHLQMGPRSEHVKIFTGYWLYEEDGLVIPDGYRRVYIEITLEK